MNSKLVPVILSGGAGTRLWPVSREAHPKPFLRLADGESLLQKTFQRAAALPDVAEVLTVTQRDFYFQTKDEYAAINPAGLSCRYVLEPFGRNTAAAVMAAALLISQQYGPKTQMLVLPADHVVRDIGAFGAAVATARELAGQDWLVTFGIRPDSPQTGYGYIECAVPLAPTFSYQVARFVEKPEVELAQTFVDSGCHFWNAGMFCFCAGVLIDEMSRHALALATAVKHCLNVSAEAESLPEVLEIEPATFAQVPSISLDYALMEKSERVAVVACEMGWSDIGAWDALGDLTEADAAGNRVVGQAFLEDVSNCYLRSEDRVIGAVGVSDLMVIDTPDALLVAHRDRVQSVRELVGQMKSVGHDAYRLHRTVHRPWGTYTVLEENARYKIKRLVVKPGATLSLQLHHHRSEHWVVVSGMARVTNDEREYFVRENESTFISAGHRHRLENPGMLDLVMIEVQSGEYVGEDDIVRFDDQYGRASGSLAE